MRSAFCGGGGGLSHLRLFLPLLLAVAFPYGFRARLQERRDVSSHRGELADGVINSELVSDHFNNGRPKLAVCFKKLGHVGRAKARVLGKTAKAKIRDLLIKCNQVGEVCCLPKCKRLRNTI